MNEYVKHEKNPQEVPQKQAKLKGTLLQTYFTSLLSLVLCVSMFLGTTYAWFTSEVNNTANEIYIGMLDVGLFAGDKDLADSSNKLFDSSIRWEPGYTALETVKVVNEGDLAFKYVLSFTDGALTAGSTSSLETVADSFEVWVYDHARNQGNAGAVAEPDSYVQLSAAGSGWESAGSLRELLSGKTVLSGAMTAIRGEAADLTGNKQVKFAEASILQHLHESRTLLRGCTGNAFVKVTAHDAPFRMLLGNTLVPRLLVLHSVDLRLVLRRNSTVNCYPALPVQNIAHGCSPPFCYKVPVFSQAAGAYLAKMLW